MLPALCIEPMTAPTNAVVRSDAESWTHRVGADAVVDTGIVTP
jgi:hypothetical protein